MQENIEIPLPKIANGTYTLHNTKKNTHRTFKIHTVRKGELIGKRIVSLLTGNDNENAYTSFGFFNNNGIFVWKSKQTETFINYADFLFKMLNGAKCDTVKVLCEKTCLICNRKLTHPESIESGIGPECKTKSFKFK